MANVERSIDVNTTVQTAYNQWTQFESFPNFMEGVQEGNQLDDKRLHWRAEIAGKTEEWDAEITEQHPDHRIAWRSTTGAPREQPTVVESRPTAQAPPSRINETREFGPLPSSS